MKNLRDAKKENNFVIFVDTFLKTDVNKLFTGLLMIELKRILKKKFEFYNKDIAGLQNTLNKSINELDKSKKQINLKLINFRKEDNQDVLFSILIDLREIFGNLKELQNEFYSSFLTIFEDEDSAKDVIYNSKLGREINLLISSLERSIKEFE